MPKFPIDYRHNSNWCEKHWAPFREPKINAAYGAIAIMEEFLNSPMFAELTDHSPEALNRFLEEGDKPLCCRLGDEVMDKIVRKAREIGAGGKSDA